MFTLLVAIVGAGLGGRVAVQDAPLAREDLAQHSVGPPHVTLAAEGLQATCTIALGLCPVAKLGDQARFAQAGIADDQHDLAHAFGGLVPALLQESDFTIAANALRVADIVGARLNRGHHQFTGNAIAADEFHNDVNIGVGHHHTRIVHHGDVGPHNLAGAVDV